MRRLYGQRRKVIVSGLILAWAFLASPSSGHSLNAPQRIGGYGHTSWTTRDGYSPGAVFAMAQTPDGYLWLAGQAGLFRFDGLKFTLWQPPLGRRLSHGPYSLLVSRGNRGNISLHAACGIEAGRICFMTPRHTLSRRRFNMLLGLGGMAASSPRWLPDAQAAGKTHELCALSAVELAARLRRGELSARDVMVAHLARIERMNPKLNAIVTVVAERAMADAARADEIAAKRGALGVLHGLPIAHKDLLDTAGIRTTLGSPFYRDQVPTQDAPLVTRLRAAGAITCGKTNTPEFGAGSQTFNTVFGATLNPYDVTKTCGGSSGGAAVALACGMLPIADGSDQGGSLRNPAAFCNVVGLRPSPGRVPGAPGSWMPLSVSGPMARSVTDVALLLSAMAGYDAGTPTSIREDPAQFRAPLARDFKGVRVAWWKGLGGIPFEPEIAQIINSQRRVFENLGCIVEEAEPDFTGVAEAFSTLRYTTNHPRYSALMRQRPEWVKDTIRYEVAEAERLTAVDVGRAIARQALMYRQSREFFQRHEYFVLPVTQVSPFDVNTPYPREIAGTAMGSYIDWMRSCWYITFMANPAISIPAGFTKGGLPVGIQIVGRHQAEFALLQMAHAYEQATGFGARRPAGV